MNNVQTNQGYAWIRLRGFFQGQPLYEFQADGSGTPENVPVPSITDPEGYTAYGPAFNFTSFYGTVQISVTGPNTAGPGGDDGPLMQTRLDGPATASPPLPTAPGTICRKAARTAATPSSRPSPAAPASRQSLPIIACRHRRILVAPIRQWFAASASTRYLSTCRRPTGPGRRLLPTSIRRHFSPRREHDRPLGSGNPASVALEEDSRPFPHATFHHGAPGTPPDTPPHALLGNLSWPGPQPMVSPYANLNTASGGISWDCLTTLLGADAA